MEAKNQKPGFRNVILLSFVSFLNDVSSEMIMPILPMFLQALGASGQLIGIAAGFRDGVASLLKILCGYCSHKTGKRKIFVYWGYGVSTVFKLLLGFSRTAGSAVAFTALERTGKGLRTAARDAILAESVTPEQRGKGFGIHRAMDSAGAVLGAGLAFILLWFAGLNFRTIIIIAGVMGLASLIPLWFVKEPEVHRQDVKLKIGLSLLPKPLRLFILVAGIFALGNFSYMFFVLRSQHLFSGQASIVVPVLLYILFNIFYSAFSVPMGSLSDKVGRQPVLVFGFGLYAVVTLGFAFCNTLWLFVVLFALYGVVFAAVDGTERALVADLAGANLKATALGTYHTVTGLAAFPASFIAGYLWENVSSTATFIFGASAAILAVAVFMALRKFFIMQEPGGNK